jgi:hypothetical protein
MPPDLEYPPVPALPHPLERLAQDRPTALDHAIVRRSTHLLAACAVAGIGLLAGVPFDAAGLLGFLGGYASFVSGLLLPRRYLSAGLYRRTLYLAEQLERRAWFASSVGNWRLLRAACHMLLGDVEDAKRVIASIPRNDLSGRARDGLDINIAILHCQIVEPDKALAVLDGIKPDDLSRYLRPCYFLVRASALALQEKFADARVEIDKVEKAGPPEVFEASCLSLRAFLKIEEDGDPAAALEISNKALAKVGKWYPGRAGMLLNHARIVLDACGDERECLELLHRVIGHEAELGLGGQAELHYLLGRCYSGSGLLADARGHAEMAAQLPATARLKKRIADLMEEVSSKLATEANAS